MPGWQRDVGEVSSGDPNSKVALLLRDSSPGVS